MRYESKRWIHVYRAQHGTRRICLALVRTRSFELDIANDIDVDGRRQRSLVEAERAGLASDASYTASCGCTGRREVGSERSQEV